MGDAVAETEAIVFTTARVARDPLQRIYDLKREIAEARRALGPIAAVVPLLEAETETTHRRKRAAPPWLQQVSLAMPLRHLNDGMLDVLVRGEGPSAVLVPMAILMAFAIVMTAVAVRLFRWDRA